MTELCTNFEQQQDIISTYTVCKAMANDLRISFTCLQDRLVFGYREDNIKKMSFTDIYQAYDYINGFHDACPTFEKDKDND